MTTWVLIVYIYSMKGVATAVVPGYESRDACITAGRHIQYIREQEGPQMYTACTSGPAK